MALTLCFKLTVLYINRYKGGSGIDTVCTCSLTGHHALAREFVDISERRALVSQ